MKDAYWSPRVRGGLLSVGNQQRHASVGYGRASAALAPDGAYGSTLPTPALMLRARLPSFLPVRRAFVAEMRGHPEDYAELERLLKVGQVKPTIEHLFPLAEGAKGFALAEAGGVVGKVVLRVR